MTTDDFTLTAETDLPPMSAPSAGLRTSATIAQIGKALAAAQGEMGGALKDVMNPHFRHKYADLASVWDACRGPLSKHGLSVVQFPRTDFRGDPEPYQWTAKQSGETRYGVRIVTVVSVRTRLVHASGEYLEDDVSTMLPTGDPQAVGSAITYLRRYALQSVVGVAPEDDDGEAAHGRGAPAGALPIQAPVPPPKPAPPKPTGFDRWWDDLQAVADEGKDALEAAWNKSAKDLRKYLTDHHLDEWQRVRAKALGPPV